ncbi:MAG TPA: hypothetical protein VMN57_08465 [Anaerolineales bacterium]|nr:hypothetical protein [Anaerolineales bacterium]
MKDKKVNEAESENLNAATRRTRFLRETLGILLGVSIAMMIGSLVPEIRERYSLGIVMLWGGALGGLLASYDRFERAGAALTRGENKVVNYLVGVGVPAGILVVIYLLIIQDF